MNFMERDWSIAATNFIKDVIEVGFLNLLKKKYLTRSINYCLNKIRSFFVSTGCVPLEIISSVCFGVDPVDAISHALRQDYKVDHSQEYA